MTNAFVRKLERFGPLDPEDRETLELLCAGAVHHRADEELLRASQPGTIPLVLSGFAYRSKLLSDGRRQIHGLLVPGDLCSHIFGTLCPGLDAVVRTLAPSTVASIPASTLQSLIQEQPRIARALCVNTVVDDAILREGVVSLGRRTAYERMAHLFCEIFLRLQAVGLIEGQSCDLPLTQTDLGDLLGLSTVHVNRVLQQLRRDELIVLKGAHLTVRDVGVLGRAADLDPTYLLLGDASTSRWATPLRVGAAERGS